MSQIESAARRFSETLAPAQLYRFLDDLTEEQRSMFEPIMVTLVSYMSKEQRDKHMGFFEAQVSAAAEGKSK